MRTLAIGPIVTFTGRVAAFSAASGVGIAQPGSVPFTWTRTATGAVNINLDPGYVILNANLGGGSGTGTGQIVIAGTPAMSVIACNSYNDAGAAADANFYFTATARKVNP